MTDAEQKLFDEEVRVLKESWKVGASSHVLSTCVASVHPFALCNAVYAVHEETEN